MSKRQGNRLHVPRRAVIAVLMAGIVLLTLCSAPSLPAGPDRTSAAQQPQQDGPRVEVVASSAQGLTLGVTIPAVVEQPVQQQAITYQRLTFLGAGSTSEIGQPELPSFGRFVAIPKGAQVQVQVVADQVETRFGYLLYPAQEPQLEQGEEPPFTLDAASYQTDEFRPSDIVAVEGPYTIRGVEVVLIRFYPVQYNAAARTLKLHASFRVTVSFTGGGAMLPDQRLRSPYFEPLLASTLLNYAQLGAPPSLGPGLAGATGCDYLIITDTALVDRANVLADWKIRKGMETCVRTTAQTGSTAAAIRSYIQNAYDSWSPPPSFVLFLGDAELIPPNYVTVHPQQEPAGSLIGTDLYYATVDGADYFPDISTGRISVDTSNQALYIVNKIVNYERNPSYSTSFYSTMALAAYFEDDNVPYNREDRNWVRTSEEIGGYMGSIGYNEIRVYYAAPSADPQYYSNGDPLPAYLLRSNGFPWDGSTAQIVNWVNSGTLILNHRDHGLRSMWVIPELQVSDVQTLDNGNRLPIVFSMNCETGWFDNETDNPAHGTLPGEITFAEAWQRNQNGGAVGVVAPTRISYGGYNDRLDQGLIDAIWPAFLSYTPSPGPSASPEYRMGQVLDYAKMYLATVYGEDVRRKITFEMFHYFGDPTMEIWTARPTKMTVSHPQVYYTGATSYSVGVQSGALVSLVKDGEMLGTAVSSGGRATATFSAPLTSGTMSLTVTKHDRRPYESAITVLDMPQRGYLPVSLSQY